MYKYIILITLIICVLLVAHSIFWVNAFNNMITFKHTIDFKNGNKIEKFAEIQQTCDNKSLNDTNKPQTTIPIPYSTESLQLCGTQINTSIEPSNSRNELNLELEQKNVSDLGSVQANVTSSPPFVLQIPQVTVYNPDKYIMGYNSVEYSDLSNAFITLADQFKNEPQNVPIPNNASK